MSAKQLLYLCLSWPSVIFGQNEVDGEKLPRSAFDLRILQESYMRAYPESMDFFSPLNSTKSDINPGVVNTNTGIQCWEMTLAQDIQEIVQDMLDSPRARLYGGENYTGKTEDYMFSSAVSNNGCYNLKTLKYRTSSVLTYGKCVRIFISSNCKGWSQALYPGGSNSRQIRKDKIGDVVSIGPCLPEEFNFASFQNEHEQTIAKNVSDRRNYFPDLIEFYSYDKKRKVTMLSIPGISISRFFLGTHNRIEFLEAVVDSRHFSCSLFAIRGENRFYKSLDSKNTEVLCYAIPLHLGGAANEMYNTFPAGQACMEHWSRITDRFSSSNDSLTMSLNFEYENGHTTRPSKFYYHISKKGFGVTYGRVLN